MKLSILTFPTLVLAIAMSSCSNTTSKSSDSVKTENTTESSKTIDSDNQTQSNDLNVSDQSTTNQTIAKTYPGFNKNNIKSQFFKIDNNKETKLTGKSGTIYIIPTRCFASKSGKIIEEPVDIEIKEAIEIEDIVFGGLYTVSNGQTLESGGMVYVDAKCKGQALQIAPNKAIDVKVPAEKTKEGMSYFQAEEKDGMLNWINPVAMQAPIVNEEQIIGEDIAIEPMINAVDKMLVNEKPNIEYASIDDVTEEEEKEFEAYIVKHPELWDTDGFIEFKNKRYELNNIPWQNEANENNNRLSTRPGSFNPHIADPNLNYFFKMNKLGWANIDRIAKGTKVQMVTKVKNLDSFKNVYVSIIIPILKIFIPGYLNSKKIYRFSHGDNEPQRFEIGSKAIVIATCKMNGKTYLSTQEITIKDKNFIELELKPSDEKKIKDKLKSDKARQ